MKSTQGFTLVELLLYISIISIIMGSLIPFGLNVIAGGAKNATDQEVFSQSRIISERLKYEIRNATAITTADYAVNFATDQTKQVTLAVPPPNNPTIISVSALGRMTIQQGAGSAVEVNSSDTRITDLTFTDYTSADTKTQHIGFTLTVISDFAQERQEYKATTSLRESAELRSN